MWMTPVFRYMTALTDSEEEEPSDEEQVDELCVLLESIDSLRQGPESDKRRSLELLLQRREEVRCLPGSRSAIDAERRVLTLCSTPVVWTEIIISLAADPGLL